MNEIDSHFDAYEHLRDMPRAADALFTLRKVASIVKPIMRKRSWRIGTLCEFYPPEANLYGLNINSTERICLRLRYPGDKNQFMPLDTVVDTMLHELCHIVIGPHNNSFHKLWKDLRDEWSSLQLKGYTGEGFLGKGRKLGGRGGKVPPLHEIRRQARAAAEKRKVLNQGSGQRLGGRPLPRGMEREAIAAAAARRATITKGCASGTKEAGKMAEEASRDGFRTKAEEDDANDRAIAEALAELWEEEEERKLYGPGSAGDGGLVWTAESGLEMNEPSTRPPGQPSRAPQQPTTRKGRPISRLVAEAEDKKSANVASASNPQRGSADSSNSTSQQTIPPSTNRDLWSCEICTLENPWNYLCCDACGVERPSSIIPLRGSGSSGRDTISSSSSRSTVQGLTQPKPREEPLGWVCSHCGAFMERQWWTCSACGRMKDSS